MYHLPRDGSCRVAGRGCHSVVSVREKYKGVGADGRVVVGHRPSLLELPDYPLHETACAGDDEGLRVVVFAAVGENRRDIVLDRRAGTVEVVGEAFAHELQAHAARHPR